MKSFVLIIIVITCGSCFAQDSLYLVAGNPFYLTQRESVVRPTIFLLNNKTNRLDSINLISRVDSTITSSINVYPQHKVMYVYEESIGQGHRKFLYMVDLRNPSKTIARELEFAKWGSRQINLISVAQDSAFICMHFGGQGYFGFDGNLKQFKVSHLSYDHVAIYGSKGIAINSHESLPLSQGHGKYFVNLKRYDSNDTAFLLRQPPKGLFESWGTYGFYDALLACNNELMAIVTNNSIPSSNEVGQIAYLIYDKQNEKWFVQRFKGGQTLVNAFDNYLVGHVSDYNHGIYFLSKTDRREYRFKRISPGIEFRKQPFRNEQEADEFSYESDVFDSRVANFGEYLPGILFIFDVKTRKYLEIVTNQGDSEILLILDNNVYYRVNDKIYISHFSVNKIEYPVLLLKDERVRDVHWAFLLK